MVHGLSCSAACGIFLDQGLNLCPLHWEVDSQPLRHQGSPNPFYFNYINLFLASTVNQEDETCFKMQVITQNATLLEPRWRSLVQIPLWVYNEPWGPFRKRGEERIRQPSCGALGHQRADFPETMFVEPSQNCLCSYFQIIHSNHPVNPVSQKCLFQSVL